MVISSQIINHNKNAAYSTTRKDDVMKQVSKLLVLFMSALLLLAIPRSAANQVVMAMPLVLTGKFSSKEFIPDPAATESNPFGKLILRYFDRQSNIAIFRSM